MPNTPMMVGEGCTVYCPGQQATEEDISVVKLILEISGICMLVPEAMINAVGALAGSGPAFVRRFLYSFNIFQAYFLDLPCNRSFV